MTVILRIASDPDARYPDLFAIRAFKTMGYFDCLNRIRRLPLTILNTKEKEAV